MNESQRVLEIKLEKLIWSYVSNIRGIEDIKTLDDLLPLLFYSAYVSSNIDLLGIDDFDEAYSLDEVPSAMGNMYTAVGYLAYFGSLQSRSCNLPQFEVGSLASRSTMQLILAWIKDVRALGLNDDSSFTMAHAIQRALFSFLPHDARGRSMGQNFSTGSIADVMTSLVSVEGKTVGGYWNAATTALPLALEKGAAEAKSISDKAPNVKVACFFGNPHSKVEIVEANPLSVNASRQETDISLTIPPLGMRVAPGLAQESFDRMWTDLFEGPAPRIRTMEEYGLVEAIWGIGDSGLALLQSATGFLFRSTRSDREIRDALVLNGSIQAVVELPAGLAAGTSIKTVLLVLGRKKQYDDILLIDMDSQALSEMGLCVRDRGRGATKITERGIEWLKDMVSKRSVVPLVSKKITTEDYLNGGAVLNYARYGEVVDIEEAGNNARKAAAIRQDIAEATSRIGAITAQIDKTIATMDASFR